MVTDRRSKRNFPWLNEYWPVILPLLLGIAIRVHGIGKQGLFFDEAYTADMITRSWDGMVEAVFRGDNHPLLYYFLMKFWVGIFPLSEFVLRSVSVFFSIISLSLATYFGIRLGGRSTGIIVGWMMAWSGLHIYYAQEARMYALLEMLWVLLPIIIYYLIEENKDSISWWIAWGVASAAAIHTHYYGFILWGLGNLLLGFTLIKRKDSKRSFKLIGSAVIVGATALPLISQILTSIERASVGGTWIPKVVDFLNMTLISLFGIMPVRDQFVQRNLFEISPWGDISVLGWSIVGCIVLCFSIMGWLLWREKESFSKALKYILVFGILPILGLFVVLNMTGWRFWAYRYFVGPVLWIVVGIGIGISKLRYKYLRIGLVCGIFVLNFGGLWAYKSQWIKDYGKQAFIHLPDETTSADILVLDRYYISPILGYYIQINDSLNVIGLAPQSDGSFLLVEILPSDTLGGEYKLFSCEQLAQKRTLIYDSAKRLDEESERWPSCVLENAAWVYNIDKLTWTRSGRD